MVGTPYGSENIDELFEEQVRARLSSLPETERIATGAGLPFLFNRFNKRIKVAFTGEDDFFRLHLSGLPHDVSKDFDQNFLRIRRYGSFMRFRRQRSHFIDATSWKSLTRSSKRYGSLLNNKLDVLHPL